VTAPLVVVEGAAGAGKTTVLRSVRRAPGVPRSGTTDGRGDPDDEGRPRRRAPRPAPQGHSAAWLIRPTRLALGRPRALDPPATTPDPSESARPWHPGTCSLVDEAGMLDQDTARALLTLADEAGARVALVGDRHQLPAVGRGGVLDHADRLRAPGGGRHPRDGCADSADEAYADPQPPHARPATDPDEPCSTPCTRTRPDRRPPHRRRAHPAALADASVRPATSSWPTPANRSPTSTPPSAQQRTDRD
jgi:hypothetical protein